MNKVKDDLTYQQALEELENIVEALEDETIPVDELGESGPYVLPRVPVRLHQHVPGGRTEVLLRAVYRTRDGAYLLPGSIRRAGPA